MCSLLGHYTGSPSLHDNMLFTHYFQFQLSHLFLFLTYLEVIFQQWRRMESSFPGRLFYHIFPGVVMFKVPLCDFFFFSVKLQCFNSHCVYGQNKTISSFLTRCPSTLFNHICFVLLIFLLRKNYLDEMVIGEVKKSNKKKSTALKHRVGV